MTLTYRSTVGRRLTVVEGDGNIAHLADSSGVTFLQSGSATSTTVQEKLRQTGIISANADFGIVGDASTDNWTQLKKMRDFMRENPRPWTVNFDPNSGTGVYHYSKNYWLKGINDITLNCEGCTFKCTNTGPASFDQSCLTGNSGVFNTWGYETYSAASTTFGYKFNTVEAGSLTVTTSTAADAGNFAAGNKVLIYGYGTQDTGFPPNPRHFEFNEVSSSDAGTGVVTLKNTLGNSYNQSWHDFSAGKGAPRILNLSRGASDFTLCKQLIVNGGYWAANPNYSGAHYFYTEGYEKVFLNNAKFEFLLPTQCGSVVCNNCTVVETEPDKVVSTLTFNGGRLRKHTGSTGVGLIKLCGDVLVEVSAQFEPHNLIIDGAHIATQNGATGALKLGVAWPMVSADIRHAKFTINDSTTSGLTNGGIETTFLVDSVSSNSKILVACANETAFETVYRQMRVGFTYQLQDGSKRVRITKIYDENATNVAIEGEFTSAPLSTETYRGASIDRLTLGPGIIQDGPYAPVTSVIFARQQFQSNEYRDSNFQTLCFSSIDGQRGASASSTSNWFKDFIIRGYVTRITIIITKIYSGSDGTNNLIVSQQLPSSTTYATVNGKTAGHRECLVGSTRGAVTGDTLTVTSSQYVDTLRFLLSNGGSNGPTYSDPTELPKWVALIEVIKSP